MNRTLKVFLACAFGAGIGAMIALQIGGYLWWIGMILVGYLSYEFKAVLMAIVYAWKKIVDESKSNQELKGIFWGLIFLSGAAASACAIFTMDQEITSKTPAIGYLTLYLLGTWLCALLFALISTRKQEFEELSSKQKMLILSLSPILFCTFWPVAFPLIVAKLLFSNARALFKTLLAIGHFFKMVFVQIHSEVRLLCLFDAGIGAAIGYYFGNPLIGALAGGCLGALNYEVVSKRVLKLVPIKSD